MEDKNSSSILKTPLFKGISKEIWKMEEKNKKIFQILYFSIKHRQTNNSVWPCLAVFLSSMYCVF